MRYANMTHKGVRVYVEPEDPDNPKDKGHWIKFFGGVSPVVTELEDLAVMERTMEMDKTFSRWDENPIEDENLSEFKCQEPGCTFSTSTAKKLAVHCKIMHPKTEG